MRDILLDDIRKHPGLTYHDYAVKNGVRVDAVHKLLQKHTEIVEQGLVAVPPKKVLPQWARQTSDDNRLKKPCVPYAEDSLSYNDFLPKAVATDFEDINTHAAEGRSAILHTLAGSPSMTALHAAKLAVEKVNLLAREAAASRQVQVAQTITLAVAQQLLNNMGVKFPQTWR